MLLIDKKSFAYLITKCEATLHAEEATTAKRAILQEFVQEKKHYFRMECETIFQGTYPQHCDFCLIICLFFLDRIALCNSSSCPVISSCRPGRP